jgi:hypothetical protein
MNTKIARAPGRIANRRKSEREREREERPLFMNSNVKRPYRTVLRKDLCREDEETLQMGSSIAEPKGR